MTPWYPFHNSIHVEWHVFCHKLMRPGACIIPYLTNYEDRSGWVLLMVSLDPKPGKMESQLFWNHVSLLERNLKGRVFMKQVSNISPAGSMRSFLSDSSQKSTIWEVYIWSKIPSNLSAYAFLALRSQRTGPLVMGRRPMFRSCMKPMRLSMEKHLQYICSFYWLNELLLPIPTELLEFLPLTVPHIVCSTGELSAVTSLSPIHPLPSRAWTWEHRSSQPTCHIGCRSYGEGICANGYPNLPVLTLVKSSSVCSCCTYLHMREDSMSSDYLLCDIESRGTHICFVHKTCTYLQRRQGPKVHRNMEGFLDLLGAESPHQEAEQTNQPGWIYNAYIYIYIYINTVNHLI